MLGPHHRHLTFDSGLHGTEFQLALKKKKSDKFKTMVVYSASSLIAESSFFYVTWHRISLSLVDNPDI